MRHVAHIHFACLQRYGFELLFGLLMDVVLTDIIVKLQCLCYPFFEFFEGELVLGEVGLQRHYHLDLLYVPLAICYQGFNKGFVVRFEIQRLQVGYPAVFE